MAEIKVKKSLIITKTFRLIEFHTFDDNPNKLMETDNDSVDNKQKFKCDDSQFIIQMFGVNEIGETCCIYIQDFQPFFYIKVGSEWGNAEVNALVSNITQSIDKRFNESIVEANLVEYNNLYGFTGGKKDKFVKLTFKNTYVMNRVKNLWYKYVDDIDITKPKKRIKIDFIFKKVKLELYESNIPPLLRYFHINNISPSGWVSIQVGRSLKPINKTTTCTYEYICDIKHLKPLPNKETQVPYKICSFDIEASSSHGDFPIPIKSYKRLAVNIVDIFIKQANFVDNIKSKILLEKIIMSAFGFQRFDGVDLVYPKIIPLKERVKILIKILTVEPIEKAKKANNTDKSYLLTINNIFEQMKEMNNEVGIGGGDEDENPDDKNVNKDEVKCYYNKSKQKNKIIKGITIIDILLSENYERDEKIQIIDGVITNLFPDLEGDKVTFIGSTFIKYGNKEPYLNHCLVLGSCDEVEGAIIETVDNETDLLLKWTELIQKENPDIIIGYNIFGFDYEFMFRRSQENHCEMEFLLLSRKIDDLCAKFNADKELIIENTKLAIASGEYDLRFFKMIGRLQIDMYAYFRRDYNLSSYKLDNIAGQFISDDVTNINHSYDTKYGNITELYTKNIAGLHIGDYIHIEITGFTSDYYKDGKKFKVLDIDKDRIVNEIYKGKEVSNVYNIIIIEGHEELDKTKMIKWGTAKDDVTPQDIFRLSNGNSSDRAIVAKYCIQDCNLVHHLMNKIDVITGYNEMARICSVPITYLVFRGQGIKLTSYVSKICREKKTLMPDLEKIEGGDGYEGAIVLPPKCSMYMDNPVACVDYSSLYPSSMISQNLSHDSKVWTKEYNLKGDLIKELGEKGNDGNYLYDNLKDYEYIDIEYDTYKYIRDTPTSSAKKTKSGKMICRWAQFPDNKKGILPYILEELLKARKDTRNMMKTEKDSFMYNILDKRQLAYKVTANSLYGQCGSRTSTFYEKDIAASTTATGRMMIIYARRIIEEVYGDMIYKLNSGETIKTRAEYIYGDSVANYTPIIVRNNNNNNVEIYTIERLAQKYGNNKWVQCIEEGKQEKEFCELYDIETWSESGWTKLYRIIRHKLAKHKKMIRIITNTGLVDVTDDHSLLSSSGNEISPKDCDIGTELLHCSNPFTCLFEIPHYKFECYKRINEELQKEEKDRKNIYFEFKNQIIASKFYTFVFNLGYTITIHNVSDNLYKLIIYLSIKKPIINNKIVEMKVIPYDGYVYDLTTENHHFSAGIGNIIVHNTDSVFFTFNLENPATGDKIRGKTALEMTIEIAKDAAKLCTQWLKPPMELSYEKTLMPFILLSKKRYVGILYEDEPEKGKLKYMGLSLKRRDSCDYLKDVYGGILNILMKEYNINTAIQFLSNSLSDLEQGKVPIDKLIITKALRSYYKKPNQIGHRVLADRIGKRDPGNEPKSGDRMKFVFIVNDKKCLMGDKIETPEYIIENKLRIDYTHYITNQLMKPLQQLFGLALVQIWEYMKKTPAIRTYNKDIELLQKKYTDIDEFMKEKEKYCSSKVKILLFDDVLNKINNKKNNLQDISSIFQNKINK